MNVNMHVVPLHAKSKQRLMTHIIILLFCIGYILIATEKAVQINKAAVALLMGIGCWCLYLSDVGAVDGSIAFMAHFGGISSLAFYLLGVMAVVGVVDRNGGFAFISSQIQTSSALRLLLRVTLFTFFLSAILDNMTTTIVMVMVLRELIGNPRQRLLFVGMVIIAANAGGAFSPIGDITTIMLWTHGNVSTLGIMKGLLIPSLACALVPMILLMPFLDPLPKAQSTSLCLRTTTVLLPGGYRMLVLLIGVGGLSLVPLFRAVTGLPPFVGIMGVLAVLWIFTELAIRQNRLLFQHAAEIRVSESLRKIDIDTILFFMGILFAVSTLEETGTLAGIGEWLELNIGNIFIVNTCIGVLSSVIDNIPLVASSISMYDIDVANTLSPYATDGSFWQLLAYCAGTGGSLLIIGSAAGIVAMGLEHISFGWYLKRFSFLALVGFLAGIYLFWLFN